MALSPCAPSRGLCGRAKRPVPDPCLSSLGRLLGVPFPTGMAARSWEQQASRWRDCRGDPLTSRPAPLALAAAPGASAPPGGQDGSLAPVGARA